MICGIELVYGIILSLGGVTFGYVLGYPSPVIPELKEKFDISQSEATFFNAVSCLIAILGPYFTQLLLMFMGRRTATFVISLIGTVTWSLLPLMTKNTIWLGILLRAVLGLVMGAYSSIIPMYTVELAPAGLTGLFGTLNNLGIAIGLLILYVISTWLEWKSLSIIGAGICAALALSVWVVDESPAVGEIKEGAKESVFQKKYARPMFVGVCLMFFQQFSGINAILTNLSDLFTSAGVKISAGLASALSSSSQIITICLSGFLVDKIGRKPAWILSTSGSVLSLILYSLSIKFDWGQWVPIIAIFLFLFFYGFAIGPVPWYIVPELFPSSVRSVATAIASSVNWLCAFMVILIFPSLQKSFGDFGSILFFAAIQIISILFGIFFITEPSKENTQNQGISENLLTTN